MKTVLYCVRLEETNWSEDTFVSTTLDNCIEYIYMNDYNLGVDADIAKVMVDDEGVIIEYLDTIVSIQEKNNHDGLLEEVIK